MPGPIVNQGKAEFVESGGKRFACYALPTPVISSSDKIEEVVIKYALPHLKNDDILFMSEKMVACTEGRAIPINDIHAGLTARVLSRFVTRSPYGIGLAMPETMQCAIDDCGLGRILLASAAGLAGRIFNKHGWFYAVAGEKAASVDGPCPYTLPPYDKYAVMSPENPTKTAVGISLILSGRLVLIVDVNDLGCKILGSSREDIDKKMYTGLLRQNPLGQSTQCTPLGILRPLNSV